MTFTGIPPRKFQKFLKGDEYTQTIDTEWIEEFAPRDDRAQIAGI